jgi:hypothetical protein
MCKSGHVDNITYICNALLPRTEIFNVRAEVHMSRRVRGCVNGILRKVKKREKISNNQIV